MPIIMAKVTRSRRICTNSLATMAGEAAKEKKRRLIDRALPPLHQADKDLLQVGRAAARQR